MTRAEAEEILTSYVERIRATVASRTFSGYSTRASTPDAAETRDARFEFGLECVLDGIAARLPESAA